MTATTEVRRRDETPRERGDRCGAEGYRFARTPRLGVYLLQRPDRTRTYTVDCVNGRCNCQSTAWHGCKHRIYCDRWFAVDRARVKLAEVRARGIEYPGEYEADLSAAEWHLRRIVGAAGAAADERQRAA